MNISLAWLDRHGACNDSRRSFIARFGKDGEPSAGEVFDALADMERADWLTWLCNASVEFAPAVGEREAANGWRSVVVGERDAETGCWLASGSATVRAYDSATVRAYGSATVEASGSATVEAYDSATVRAYDSATVRAYGSATVEAYDSATVEASGSATVLLMQYFADGVKVFLHGSMACAIDRRGNTLKLLTAAEQETEVSET